MLSVTFNFTVISSPAVPAIVTPVVYSEPELCVPSDVSENFKLCFTCVNGELVGCVWFVSDLRLKTLIKICEAAQSSGDGGTINNIALQLKATQFDTETDLGKQAVKCIEAGFPSDEKSASFEGMIVKINKLKSELRELCFNLLELKPTQAITFEPCKEFY
ncbi:MAG: hypothetical protein EBW83_06075 [Rhodobacterales bacterium]|nr:hypothetical protein [Rhodobacterales bacterium]